MKTGRIKCRECGEEIRRKNLQKHSQEKHSTTGTVSVVVPQAMKPSQKDMSISTRELRDGVRLAVKHSYEYAYQGVPFQVIDPILKKLAPTLNTTVRHTLIFTMETLMKYWRMKLAGSALFWTHKPVKDKRLVVARPHFSPSTSSGSDTETSDGTSSPESSRHESAAQGEIQVHTAGEQSGLQLTELTSTETAGDLILTVHDEVSLPHPTSQPLQAKEFVRKRKKKGAVQSNVTNLVASAPIPFTSTGTQNLATSEKAEAAQPRRDKYRRTSGQTQREGVVSPEGQRGSAGSTAKSGKSPHRSSVERGHYGRRDSSRPGSHSRERQRDEVRASTERRGDQLWSREHWQPRHFATQHRMAWRNAPPGRFQRGGTRYLPPRSSPARRVEPRHSAEVDSSRAARHGLEALRQALEYMDRQHHL